MVNINSYYPHKEKLDLGKRVRQHHLSLRDLSVEKHQHSATYLSTLKVFIGYLKEHY